MGLSHSAHADIAAWGTAVFSLRYPATLNAELR